MTKVSRLTRKVLDRWLPEDAAERCSGRVFVLNHGPDGHRFDSEFRTREELLRALTASGYVPILSDGRLVYTEHASVPHVDGAWKSCREAVLLCRPRSSMRTLVDHNHDVAAHADGYAWWQVATPEVWEKRFELGKAYAREMLSRGELPMDVAGAGGAERWQRRSLQFP